MSELAAREASVNRTPIARIPKITKVTEDCTSPTHSTFHVGMSQIADRPSLGVTVLREIQFSFH